MISVQNGTDVGSGAGAGTAGERTLDAEDDTVPSATGLVIPCTELVSRRVNGIHMPRSLVRRLIPVIAKTSSSIDGTN